MQPRSQGLSSSRPSEKGKMRDPGKEVGNYKLLSKKKTGKAYICKGLIGCIFLYCRGGGEGYSLQFIVWSNELQQHYNQECGN